VWTKLGALEMRRPSRCLGSSPSFSAKLDSKPGRSLAPPAKRVARLFGWVSNTLLSANGKWTAAACSPVSKTAGTSGYWDRHLLFPQLESYLWWWGGPPGKRDVLQGIRFDSVVFRRKCKLFVLFTIKYKNRDKKVYI